MESVWSRAWASGLAARSLEGDPGRDVVGVRYGFVSYGVARLIMIHATLGFPVLDMDEEARS